MFKIEKNIPLPTSRGGGRRGKYPFRHMEIGDSFVAMNNQNSISSAAIAFARYAGDGRKYSTRKQPDGSIRVWRIA